ncbi:MAG: hypothetical protein K6F50_09680 [Kiritimatiellae bacterium]|nr:hypothetical protein [Kiritimatiellia bacterium]
MKRLLVLANPSSHGGRSGRRLPRLQELLPEGEFVVLKDIDEARRLAREASGYEAVVACGGDGTVNAVAGGVLANPDDALKFGVLYTGTSPDFCREHGIPVEPEKAAEVLRNGFARAIPALVANGEPFFCSMNLGMGAAVAASANRLRPKIGDFMGTLWSVLREVMHGRRYDIEVNGETIRNVAHMLVTRMTRIAGGLKVSLPSLADDEYALWFARDVSRLGCLKLVWNMYCGRLCGEVRVLRGKTAFSSRSPVELEYDGDPHGNLPAVVSLAARPLRLIVPGQTHSKMRLKR